MDAAFVSNFIVFDTGHRSLPDQLIGYVRDFADSQKYAAIDDSECNRPETVLSALCIRPHRQQLRGHLQSGVRTTLQEIHNVFERIAQGDLPSTKDMLVTVMLDRLAQDSSGTMVATSSRDYDRMVRAPESTDRPLPRECGHR